MAKFVTAAEAVELIKDNDTVAMSGFGANVVPENLLIALGERYEKTGHPKNLTVMKGVALGNFEPEKGLSRLTKMDGLITTLYYAHVALEPNTVEAINENKIAAYSLPLGTMAQWFRSMVGRRPGFVTKVGLKTYADPRFEGSIGNQAAADQKTPVVELVTLGGEEMLYYKYKKLDACIIRATYADEDGNLSFRGEAIIAHLFEIAAATRNAGGIVIVQVSDILQKGSINARDVAVQCSMVDYIVKADHVYSSQSLEFEHPRPSMSGEYKIPAAAAYREIPLNERKILGRRANFELKRGAMVNCGIGIPETVANVAYEEGLAGSYQTSIETGLFGGMPLIGQSFGAVDNAEVIMTADQILEWYDGGGLDICCLGAAEFDKHGNVNASKFNGRCVGPGGFIDISQNSKKAIFLGTFMAGGLKVEGKDGKLIIHQEGKIRKLKDHVEQITFSAEYAMETGQEVIFITERAVFKPTPKGLKLCEYAPGIDLQKDILDKMDFAPIIEDDLKLMDARIFTVGPMGLTIE